jgi:hypothetical protein
MVNMWRYFRRNDAPGGVDLVIHDAGAWDLGVDDVRADVKILGDAHV